MNSIRNRRLTSSPRKQAGFGMALVLGVLAVMAIIAGVIALSNKGSAGKTDLETAKGMAEAMVDRGNSLYTNAQRIAGDRDITKLELATTPVTSGDFGLYDPAIGVESDIALPAKAFSTGVDTHFALDKTNIKITGLGSGGVDALALAVVLPSVTTQTCQFVNKTIYSDSLDTAIPSVSSSTAITRTEGCAVINSVNTYYKVLGPAA